MYASVVVVCHSVNVCMYIVAVCNGLRDRPVCVYNHFVVKHNFKPMYTCHGYATIIVKGSQADAGSVCLFQYELQPCLKT